ncbi:MAG TPA: hypothetical protein DEP66_05020 [Acidimicrobiaceae bacterium]|nr:hypothetical protein [Acidimicrobiaceae bacterium]
MTSANLNRIDPLPTDAPERGFVVGRPFLAPRNPRTPAAAGRGSGAGRGPADAGAADAGADAGVRSITSAPSARFAVTARAAGDIARSLGLKAPGFMSPPRLAGADRTIRRPRPGDPAGEGCVVAVRVKGRPFAAVQADVVDGVIAANDLDAAAATKVRNELWRRLTTLASDGQPPGWRNRQTQRA